MKTISYQDLLKTIAQKGIKLNRSRLDQVYQLAESAHQGQLRQTGDPYITHPLFVANTIASWGLDQDTIEAALLHDTVEDTSVTLEDIHDKFGPEVAFLVDSVTKVGQVKLRNNQNVSFVENLRKMFVAMAKDIRVVLIRLADRHHNMLTLDAVPLSKQKRIAKETLQIYAPLAERLGMGDLKGELEDLAFPFVRPQKYQQISKLSKKYLVEAEKNTKDLIKEIKKVLKDHQLDITIHGRHKKKYSLFNKLSRPEIANDITKVHDLIAVRVITKDKRDCYTCLGVIHGHFKPVPYIGISDFIAQPKPNGYQSIHTKVFDNKGHIVEVQIRSQEMHVQAEYGAAAHHAYSEAKTNGASADSLEKGTAFKLSQKMHWVDQLAKWQQQVESSQDFITDLKLDALSHRIYVFSPLGDVYDLPAESTPVDFAVAVHSNLLNHLQAAKVNQKLVPLDYRLKSGDVVEIIKLKKKRLPSRDWLQFVKSSKAKSRIKKFLQEEP